MGIVDKALWYVETHIDRPVTLAHMARDLATSPFHLTRSFATLTGQPVIRYLWRRRLSRAAEALVAGETSITMLALDAGYQSPEAFSRAFRAEFGLTPRQLRRKATLAGLSLTQPMEFFPMPDLMLAPPTIETMPARHFAGPMRRYDIQSRAGIPAQWDALREFGQRPESPTPRDHYGIIADFDDAKGEFDYYSAQEVAATSPLPEGFSRITLPAGRWARFASGGHISTMIAAWTEVMNHWLTQPGLVPRRGASVEHYPPTFDGQTGRGGFEIWVPIED